MAMPEIADNPNSDLGITGRVLPRIYLKLPPDHARYYKIHVLDDGYPAQRFEGGEFYEHPLYPTYLIEEFVAQYEAAKNPETLAAAEMIATAALKRMQRFGDALVFWYPGEGAHARVSCPHYSALTQAYYTRCFFDLWIATNNSHYEDVARQSFASLTIAVEKEGVARYLPYGIGMEELPLATPDLILNGWLSAIAALCEKPQLVARLGISDFIARNLDALEKLLPDYDCPGYRNSRYSLSGPLYVRLRLLTSKAPLVLRDVRFSVGAGFDFDIGTENDSRWANYAFAKDVESQVASTIRFRSHTARFNLVASQFSLPNQVSFTVDKPVLGLLALEAYLGRYEPLASAPVDGKWTRLSIVGLYGRRKACKLAIPKSAMDLVGYPTNFAKVLDGRNRNIYHETHIRRLTQIAEYQNRPIFRHYAEKWRRYTREWTHDPRYMRFAPEDAEAAAFDAPLT